MTFSSFLFIVLLTFAHYELLSVLTNLPHLNVVAIIIPLFQYGLYASIVPGFLYTVFGTIREVTIGPTAVNALISYNYAGPSAARALTLAFWTGVIQISLAFFQMGKL